VEFLGFLILLGVVAWVVGAAFKAGKREGSRKAYAVGFARGRRAGPKGQSGCLLALLMAFVTAAIAVTTFRPPELSQQDSALSRPQLQERGQ
jgi:hypothetical protein